ncbi:AraC family transcriptional regulator [Marinobacter alexandrii]|uniref:AraC family transcriptional regulator n=1 Tax=Marinobacter alexandrii TaxID=2570351 RepID=UPI001FFEAA18|nr:AraC family transcriptional regulator [Marinobacter alexandrii]MCK2148786.1 AraC family transcriptional regulator [Marinobacter alexandrii]
MSDARPSLELKSYSDHGQRHAHDHHQLVLPLVGTLSLSVDSKAGEVSGGKAAIIAAGHDHDFTATNANRFVVADIPAALAPMLEKLPCFVQLDAGLEHYVQFLHSQLQQGDESSQTPHQMLLLLIQLLQERFGDKLRLDRRVETAKRFIDENYHQKITVSQLTSISHLSSRQLNELFREQVGLTPHHYLTELRMQASWQLLERGDLSIQSIADAVGYSSLSAFSDRFAQHFGHSPSYFRRLSK